MISPDQLIACGIGPTQAAAFAAPLAAALARFDITTPARIAGFLGQAMVETTSKAGLLTRFEEDLSYSDPAHIVAVFPREFPDVIVAADYVHDPLRFGSRVYADRLGNGDEASGDGFRFRGRGFFDLTGRASYAAASAALGVDYVSNPDLVAEPADACLTAAWFWSQRGLNAPADAGNFDGITRVVNGPGMLQAPLRKQYSERALNVFSE